MTIICDYDFSTDQVLVLSLCCSRSTIGLIIGPYNNDRFVHYALLPCSAFNLYRSEVDPRAIPTIVSPFDLYTGRVPAPHHEVDDVLRAYT